MAIMDSTLDETLKRHALCKVIYDGLTVFRVLCLKCRNATNGFKREAFSELKCDNCGAEWKMPPGANLFVKDKTVVITARYPDLESARNKIS
jgi:ribosomal protein S27E